MATRQEEVTGGSYSIPFAAGTWTKADDQKHIVGFIAADDGDATNITYFRDETYPYAIYTGCYNGHYYHFPQKVSEVTFSMDVTLVFE